MPHEVIKPRDEGFTHPGARISFYYRLQAQYPHKVELAAYYHKVKMGLAPRLEQLSSGASWTVRRNIRTGWVRAFAFETAEELREFRAEWPRATLSANDTEKLIKEQTNA